ncbi:hypothetical protein HDU84_002725 [Entophlyctis sp. JEL0112]|nr:hypothetical protein HDU84_002725 [Entophlyctis sp. JEL0112]
MSRGGFARGPVLRVGDLLQLRRAGSSGGAGSAACVVVREPCDSDPFFTSLTPQGHSLRHSANDIRFVVRGWSTKVQKQQLGADDSIRRSPKVKADSTGLLAHAQLPDSLLAHLARFEEVVEQNLFSRATRARQMHAHFITHSHSVSVSDSAKWLFSVDTPSPAELYAVYSFMLKNPKHFSLASDRIVPEDSSALLFDLIPEEEVSNISWLESQTRGSQPGDALVKFLEKVQILLKRARELSVIDVEALSAGNFLTPRNSLDNSDPVHFSDTDKKFIKAIRIAACQPFSSLNPNIYLDIVSQGILSRIEKTKISSTGAASANAKRSAAIRLLKDIGVLTPWENTSIESLNTNGLLAGIPNHGMSTWADSAKVDSEIWVDRCFDEFEVNDSELHKSNRSEPIASSHNINDALKAKVPLSDPLLEVIRDKVVFPSIPISDSFVRHDPMNPLRHDFGQMPVFVIDSPTAQELDDGISVEHTASNETWVHIHIADPTSVLPPTHPLSSIAQLRASSMYLPERHYPMLPDSLSDRMFNLGKSKNVLTFSCRIGDDDIIDYKIRPGLVRNVKILHYKQVNEVLDWSHVYGISNSVDRFFEPMPWVQNATKVANRIDTSKSESAITDAETIESLRVLQQLAFRHLQCRIKNGGFVSDQPSFSVKVLPYPQPFSPISPDHAFEWMEVLKRASPDKSAASPLVVLESNASNHLEPASNMVSECMIMANRVAAKFCAEHGVPAVFRGQAGLKDGEGSALAAAALDHIDPVSGVLPFGAFRRILPYFSSATISSVPTNHFSLGIRTSAGFGSGYMKVTSPLRRYKDMMMHWLIKQQLLKDAAAPLSGSFENVFSAEDVVRIAQRSHEIERLTDKVSSASEKFWALEWISRREILWRSGAPQEIVDGGVPIPSTKVSGVCMPSIGVGPRGPVIWGPDYRGLSDWGSSCGTWEVPFASRCSRPIYSVVITREWKGSTFGILGDLGGIEARVNLNFPNQKSGSIVPCAVETVDPANGVLIVSEI